MAIDRGAPPAAKGDPGTALNTPVVESMAYADTSFESSFATKANAPEGSMATLKGNAPAAAVDARDSAPLEGVIE